MWNYCNEMAVRILKREHRFCSSADLDKLTAGATKEGLSLHSQTVQAISAELVTRRKQFKKRRLSWRKSGGARRSLGWIPVKASALRCKGGQVWYCGKPLSLWDSYCLADYTLGTGSFSEDSRGRWYLNVTVKVPAARNGATAIVGVDAGWSAFRTMLQYKCDSAGVWFEEVDEAFSTQTCSCCKQRTGPKGVAGLGIRGWQCSACGTVHDRDVNAAKNILAADVRAWQQESSSFRARRTSSGGTGRTAHAD